MKFRQEQLKEKHFLKTETDPELNRTYKKCTQDLTGASLAMTISQHHWTFGRITAHKDPFPNVMLHFSKKKKYLFKKAILVSCVNYCLEALEGKLQGHEGYHNSKAKRRYVT